MTTDDDATPPEADRTVDAAFDPNAGGSTGAVVNGFAIQPDGKIVGAGTISDMTDEVALLRVDDQCGRRRAVLERRPHQPQSLEIAPFVEA